jgi:hypothetical protein
VNTIRRINQGAEDLFAEVETHSAETTDSIHMLVLALQHLENCIRFLGLPEGREFRRAWRRVGVLRNALEHEEEYVAGGGRNRDDVVGRAWLNRGMFESHFLTWDERGIQTIGFMGRNYSVQAAIVAALELEPRLLELWDPPIQIVE